MSDLPPANWYPDPEVPGQQRYWDGAQWTEHRAPGAGAAATGPQDPAGQPGAPTQPQYQQPYGQQQYGQPSYGQQATNSTNGMAITALVVGILSLLLSIVVIGAVGGVIAIVLGIVALRQLRSREGQGGRGLAISGIATGGLAIVIGIVVVVAVGAVSNLMQNNSDGIVDFFECIEEAERTGGSAEDC